MNTVNLNQAIRPTYNLLKITFGIVPIVAGLDKFTNILANWEQYLSPATLKLLPFSGHTFMMIAGVLFSTVFLGLKNAS